MVAMDGWLLSELLATVYVETKNAYWLDSCESSEAMYWTPVCLLYASVTFVCYVSALSGKLWFIFLYSHVLFYYFRAIEEKLHLFFQKTSVI